MDAVIHNVRIDDAEFMRREYARRAIGGDLRHGVRAEDLEVAGPIRTPAGEVLWLVSRVLDVHAEVRVDDLWLGALSIGALLDVLDARFADARDRIVAELVSRTRHPPASILEEVFREHLAREDRFRLTQPPVWRDRR